MQNVQAAVDGALGDAIATGATYDPAALWIGVATAVTSAGLATTLSDLTQASGAMATRHLVSAWSSVYHAIDGSSYVIGPEALFAPASSAEAQTLAAWFLADASAAGNLVGFGLITPPVNLTDASTQWSIVLRLSLGESGIDDMSVIFDG